MALHHSDTTLQWTNRNTARSYQSQAQCRSYHLVVHQLSLLVLISSTHVDALQPKLHPPVQSACTYLLYGSTAPLPSLQQALSPEHLDLPRPSQTCNTQQSLTATSLNSPALDHIPMSCAGFSSRAVLLRRFSSRSNSCGATIGVIAVTVPLCAEPGT